MKSRRSFFKKTLAFAGTFAFTFPVRHAKADHIAEALAYLNTLTPEEAAIRDEIWDSIAKRIPFRPPFLI